MQEYPEHGGPGATGQLPGDRGRHQSEWDGGPRSLRRLDHLHRRRGGPASHPPVIERGLRSAATLTLTTLGSGDHFVTAAYGGSATFGPSSTAQPAEVTITGPALTSTTTTLTASPTTADLGQPVTFTAIVAASGQGSPTGDVTFSRRWDHADTGCALGHQRAGRGDADARLTDGRRTRRHRGVRWGCFVRRQPSDPVDVKINPPALAPTSTTITASPTTGQTSAGRSPSGRSWTRKTRPSMTAG